MNADLRLDGITYKIPMDRFTGRTLGYILKHPEGTGHLSYLKRKLAGMEPLKDEKLKELLEELRSIKEIP